MDTAVILLLVVVGALVTLAGLTAAYYDARRQVRTEQVRIDRTTDLIEQERVAMAAIPVDAEHLDERNAEQQRWNERWVFEGLQRASWGNLPQLAQFEAQRLVGELLVGARYNLLLAGLGVVLGTAGSVWDIARG